MPSVSGSPSSSPEPARPAERIPASDDGFPPTLRDLGDAAPAHLWIRGRREALQAVPLVAVVGTRRATNYGLRVTRELAGALGRAGACVVSGMAIGIDAAAHRAALESGALTIAVLGTGIDVVYPPAHRRLQREIAAQGALVTELEPLQTGRKFTFPQRNRIIAALASVTIVVEAPFQSGALITAAHALALGRTLGVVPGPIDQPACAGSNRWMLDGAVPITSIEEALTLVGLTPALRTPRIAADGDEGRVWSALAHGSMDVEALCAASGLPAARCLAAVTTLELSGAIECALTGDIRRR